MKKQILIPVIAAAIAAASACGAVWLHNELALSGTLASMEINRPELTAQEPEDVYGTDAAVYVDGRGVQAYEIGGKTEIAVEDLSHCGFTVESGENKIRVTTNYPEDYEQPEISVGKTDLPLGQTVSDNREIRINNIMIEADSYNGKHYIDVDTLGALADEYNQEVGWSDYNFRTTRNGNIITIDCFRFPTIDVPAILADMKPMVDKPEYVLYTEGERRSTARAPFEPETGILAGINSDGNGDWLARKPKIFKNNFSVYSNYIEFDNGQTDVYNNSRRTFRGKDALLLVPWNTGDVTLAMNNDEYIRTTLNTLKGYNRPVIIRYACEMNVSELGDSPTAYVKAFRHVADIVHEYGFAMMWSVNDVGALNKPYGLYYPGDEYVDWVGASVFPTYDFAQKAPTVESEAIMFGCGDYGWHTNNLKYITRFMEENNINKPLAISEGAIETYLAYEGAPTDFQEWGEARVANMYWYLPMRYPNLKMIIYFNVTADGKPAGSDLT